jgi:hypothetical protein
VVPFEKEKTDKLLLILFSTLLYSLKKSRRYNVLIIQVIQTDLLLQELQVVPCHPVGLLFPVNLLSQVALPAQFLLRDQEVQGDLLIQEVQVDLPLPVFRFVLFHPVTAIIYFGLLNYIQCKKFLAII